MCSLIAESLERSHKKQTELYVFWEIEIEWSNDERARTALFYFRSPTGNFRILDFFQHHAEIYKKLDDKI